MPRDLEQELATPSSSSSLPLSLTESPNSVATERSDSPSGGEEAAPLQYQRQQQFVMVPPDQQKKKKTPANLHPYTRPLTIDDLESVVAVENASFSDPGERATKEKLAYRLSKCGELCYGIFCTVEPNSDLKAETLATGRPVETSRGNGAISVLIGHVISAKTTSPSVSDESMDYPKDWESEHPAKSAAGHQEHGRTIALHSVAVLPAFQGRGLGRVLMLSYMQHMNGAGIADRLALIAHDHLIPWYQKLGFMNKGKSDAQFGGGGWSDLIFELKTLEARAVYG